MPLYSVSLTHSFSMETEEGMQQGKVIYDYTPNQPGQLTLYANELILVKESGDMDYFNGKKGTSEGKVPKACILLL